LERFNNETNEKEVLLTRRASHLRLSPNAFVVPGGHHGLSL
jgi:8-oxo-dGTP pyrophosphatase MutT (NUDIX family)